MSVTVTHASVDQCFFGRGEMDTTSHKLAQIKYKRSTFSSYRQNRFGFILRDHQGSMVAASTWNLSQVVEPICAKAMCVKEALS